MDALMMGLFAQAPIYGVVLFTIYRLLRDGPAWIDRLRVWDIQRMQLDIFRQQMDRPEAANVLLMDIGGASAESNATNVRSVRGLRRVGAPRQELREAEEE